MTSHPTTRRAAPPRLAPWARLLRCRRAAIAPMTALLIVPIAGAIAYAVELGSWQYMQRSAQNAADSAALAAATVADTGGSTTAEMEARGAAKKHGFTNGANGVAVTAATTACPSGMVAGSTCYEAVVTTSMPFTFASLIGFTGSGGGRQNIAARSVSVVAGGAGGGGPVNDVCIWTFSHLNTDGTPQADLNGCAILSEGNMICSGNGVEADFAVAAGTITGPCADPEDGTNIPNATDLPEDPYAAAANSIPANPCGGSYPKHDKGNVGAGNQISGSRSGEILLCGDVKLTGNVTLTGNATKLVIYNGRLDLNRFTLKTAAGASATVIFSGTTASDYQKFPVDAGTGSGSGILEIEAPTGNPSDPWNGIAIYQDPRMGDNGVDFIYTGNKPAWKVSGVMYFPYSDTDFRGIVDKADDGVYCQILVAYTVRVSGTGKVIGDVSGCEAAGIDPPTVVVGPGLALRERLVQ
jgi:Flp pilus assembly protein TadG